MPVEVEEYVARDKLASMGIQIDATDRRAEEVHERLGAGHLRRIAVCVFDLRD